MLAPFAAATRTSTPLTKLVFELRRMTTAAAIGCEDGMAYMTLSDFSRRRDGGIRAERALA